MTEKYLWEFIPDETLIALANSTNPVIVEFLVSKIPVRVREALKAGKPIPLTQEDLEKLPYKNDPRVKPITKNYQER